LSITVVPKLELGMSARRIRRRRRLAVSGVVTPSNESHAVMLLERRVRGRYRRVRRRRAVLNDGRFLRLFRPTRPGLYRVTVRVAGASARKHVRVLR
jgi:hypothetical protein